MADVAEQLDKDPQFDKGLGRTFGHDTTSRVVGADKTQKILD